MPSRASNAALMVDSRAGKDIGFPWRAGSKAFWIRRLCRDSGEGSQGSLSRRPGYRAGSLFVARMSKAIAGALPAPDIAALIRATRQAGRKLRLRGQLL